MLTALIVVIDIDTARFLFEATPPEIWRIIPDIRNAKASIVDVAMAQEGACFLLGQKDGVFGSFFCCLFRM